MKRLLALAIFATLSFCAADRLAAQALGNAGTLEGTVVDASGAVLPNAVVKITNRVTNYEQAATTDGKGVFRLTNIPPNPYHIQVSAPNFASAEQDVDVRSTVPISLKIPLALAGTKFSVTVEAAGADLLENVPYAHNDVDMSSLSKLSVSSPGAGVSDAVVLSSGAVAADSNGFFHPLGDHAQTSFSVDGQPIGDQQSKAFSTQIPLDAIQSMELITGTPPAEFGDKTSLIVNAQTRSGLGQKPNGSFEAQRGSFATYSEQATFGMGGAKVGNFFAFNALRSGRFLDTPELRPIHAIGNNGTVFDHFDYRPTGGDAFHLNALGARNWFQIPNTYDQLGQDQRQQATTISVAPGYQHTFSNTTLLTINSFYRADTINYYPSPNFTNDTPATISQHRTLTNWGVKGDVSYVKGRQNLKMGTQLMQTRLHEQFAFGITDPTDPGFLDPDTGNLLAGLAPFDLTSPTGKLFKFDESANVNQYAFFVQDSIKFGNLNVQAGLRIDIYHGLVSDSSLQPRIGFSYLIPKAGTVLRASYSRTFETPYNENLILSSATGVGGLAANAFGGVSEPLPPGNRNQYNLGLEQSFGKYVIASADYFWKYTNNAYDFGVLFNTPIAFPISWNRSKLDGVAVRIGTPNLRGFQWITTMGHTRARYFGPETGGLVFNGDVGGDAVFRIDHDQAFQQTTELRYQLGKRGPWVSWTWRYDSGLVAGAVGSLDDALGLTGAQQAAIGFFCGNSFPTVSAPLTPTQCTPANYGATRLRIPAPGTADDDHNPPRIAPRHLFDIALGTENLFKREHFHTTLKFVITNVTNKDALYNFLSTFSGTHFVQPRAYQTALGFVF